MIRKKSGFLTFCFSLLPGAGQMYWVYEEGYKPYVFLLFIDFFIYMVKPRTFAFRNADNLVLCLL
jgi:hypothetical protein